MIKTDIHLNLVYFRQEKEGYWIWISCTRRVWNNWRLFWQWPALSKVRSCRQSYFYNRQIQLWFRVWTNRKTNRGGFQISSASRLPSHWLISLVIRSQNIWFRFPLNPFKFFPRHRIWDKHLLFNFSKIPFLNDKLDHNTEI